MAGDPFGLLLRQRIVFLGGEASLTLKGCRLAAALYTHSMDYTGMLEEQQYCT